MPDDHDRLPSSPESLPSTDAQPEPPPAPVLAAMVESMPLIVAVFALPELEAVYVNAAAHARFLTAHVANLGGLRLNDVIGLASLHLLQSEILPETRVLGTWSGKCEFRDAWGSEFAALATFSTQRDNGKTYVCLQARPADPDSAAAPTSFTDRELLRALLNNLPESVYFKDASSRFLRISKAQAAKLGLSDPTAAIGKTDFDFFSAAHASDAFADERRILRTGEAIIDKEEQETWDDGRLAWVSSTKLPLRDQDGKIIGTFGISHDITTRKAAEATRQKMEAQLQQAYKLESLGRLAAGVAHEINTPTQYITDNTHFMADAFAKLQAVVAAYRALRTRLHACRSMADVPATALGLKECASAVASAVKLEKDIELDYLLSEVPRCVQQSLDGLARVARIVRSLKEIAHPNSPDLTPADLNRAIETAIAVSRHEWKYVADVNAELDADLPPVPCVVDEFSQTILNLLVNAAHAIEDVVKGRPQARGKITVRTRREADHAVIEVEDTGTGIPDSVRARIFEPFFTTKPVGKGTGQGLAIVHTVVVNHHHGLIEVKTTAGEGTTFILRLPLVSASKTPPAAVESTSPDHLP